MITSKKLQSRYNTLKQQEPDCLLLMQVGIFMQVMNDDARAVSEVTGLKTRLRHESGGFASTRAYIYVNE